MIGKTSSRGIVQITLGNQAVFQMDETTFEHQEILWTFGTSRPQPSVYRDECILLKRSGTHEHSK